MSKEKMHSNKSEELKFLIKKFLEKLSNDYAFLFFSQHGLEILSKGGMGGKKFSEVPTFTLGEGGPEDPNAIILYHEIGKIIHENICKDYPRRMMNHFIIDLYESWEKTRSSLSEIFEKNRNEIKSDIFGDVRNARNDLLHKSCKAIEVKKNKLWKIHSEVVDVKMDDIKFILSETFDYLNSLLPAEAQLKDRSLSIHGKEIHRSWNHKL